MFLDVCDLTVDFGKTRALDHVSFSLDAGSIAVLTGKNGAGKSTLLWAVSGLLLPTAGRVTFPSLAASRPVTGFLSHQNFLYEELTVLENLELTAHLHGLEDSRARIRRMVECLGLDAQAEKRVSELSRGQIQRVALARSVLPDPALLLLDEPFSNLDPSSAELVRSLIESLRTAARLILLATNDLRFCQPWSSRVIEVEAGRIVS